MIPHLETQKNVSMTLMNCLKHQYLLFNVHPTQLTNDSSPPPLTNKTPDLPFHPSSPPRHSDRPVSPEACALHLAHIEHLPDRCACGPSCTPVIINVCTDVCSATQVEWAANGYRPNTDILSFPSCDKRSSIQTAARGGTAINHCLVSHKTSVRLDKRILKVTQMLISIFI